ncbi:MAG: tetratricopeptide (TPR) repeat protein [Myxococcota bacterium]|jgi:tetratricopeptide (TPR) repeat protein
MTLWFTAWLLVMGGTASAAEYATRCVELRACDERVGALERRLSTGDLARGIERWMVHREVGKIRLGTSINRDAEGDVSGARLDLQVAVAHLKQALRDAPKPQRIELHMAIAEGYEAMEPGTLRVLGPLADVILEDPYAPDARKAHLDRGERLLEHDQLAEAELAFLMGMDRSGDAADLTAAAWFGYCAWQLGQPDAALQVLTAALERRAAAIGGPSLLENHVEEAGRLVEWYADLPVERTDELLALFSGLAAEAGQRWALVRLAAVRHAQGDWDESEALHARLLAAYPADPVAPMWLAARIDVASERDRPDVLEQWAREIPGWWPRWRDGQGRDVRTAGEQAMQLALTKAGLRYVDRAKGYTADGYPERAEAARRDALLVYAAFLAAFDGHPATAAVHQYSAEVNRVLGQPEPAFFHYAAALRSDPMGQHDTDLAVLYRGRCAVAAARVRPSREARPLRDAEADLVRAADEAVEYLSLTDADTRRCTKAAADVLQDHGQHLEADLRYLPLFEAEGDLSQAREVAGRVVAGLKDRSKWGELSAQASYFAGHMNLLASEDKSEMQRIAAGAALRRIEAEVGDPVERAIAYLAWERRQGLRVIADRDTALYLAAVAYDQAGQPEDALAVRRELVARFPDSDRRVPALLALGDAALARWNLPEAARALGAYAAAAPPSAEARRAAYQAVLIRQDHRWKRTPQVADLYWDRWPAGPERFEVAILAGDWHAVRRRHTEAQAWYARVHTDRAAGDLRFAAWRAAGLAAYAAGRPADVDTFVADAVGAWHAEPGSPDAAADLGALLLDAWIAGALDNLGRLDVRIRLGQTDAFRGPVELYATIAQEVLPRVEVLARLPAPDARRTAAVRVGDAYVQAAARLLDAPIPRELSGDGVAVYVREVRTRAREWQLEGVDFYAGAVRAAREQGTWDADLDRAIRRMGVFDPSLCGDVRPCRLTPIEVLPSRLRVRGWGRQTWEATP